MQVNALPVADALFAGTQQRVLGLLFGQPGRSFFATEIIGRVGAGSGAVQRELQKLSAAGLIRSRRLGNQKHYLADRSAPLFAELCGLVQKVVNLELILAQALVELAPELDLALVHGPAVEQSLFATSPVDVLVVTDRLSLEQLFGALAGAERYLGRSIAPRRYNRAEFQQRLGQPLLQRILAGPHQLVSGQLPLAA